VYQRSHADYERSGLAICKGTTKDPDMPTETKQMEAVVIQAAGPPAQSLAYRSEPVPEPGPGEVLVEVTRPR
jgi:hypothetical protein